MPFRRIFLSALISMIVFGLVGMTPAAARTDWRERVQVVYDPVTRSVHRALVRIADPFAGLNLDFTWHPDRGPGLNPDDGTVEGAGRLTWRIPGTASYDPDAAYAVYQGTLQDGKMHGEGRMTLRSGEMYDGGWQNGLRSGHGVLRDPDGNHYVGSFVNGLPEGDGIYTSRDGTIYDGPFRSGLRDGRATIRLPGGTKYQSQWVAGVEVQSDRPDAIVDALVGGLLKAQAGDQASRVNVAPVIDQRMTAMQALGYQAQPNDGLLNIYPQAPEVVEAWNGTTAIEEYGISDLAPDWSQNEAYLNLLLDAGRSPVTLRDMWVEVSSSIPENRPMMEVENKVGCIGYRPHFVLANHGWGPVERAVLRFRFIKSIYAWNLQRPANYGGTEWFTLPIAGFSDVTAVDVSGALQQLGLDIGRLKTGRFLCTATDLFDTEYCLNEFTRNVRTGRLEPFLWINQSSVVSEVEGELEYFWRDAYGQLNSRKQPLVATVSIGLIENISMAEQGDYWEGGADAQRQIPVDFQQNANAYSIPLPYRGSKTVTRMLVPLKLRAPTSSWHDFRAAVRFADNSIRYSQPMRLFYMKPRMELNYSTVAALEPSSCVQQY